MPSLPPVSADRSRIVQVIVNLLSNAARNSPPSSPIELAAIPEDEQVDFSVTDEGRGIPSEQLPGLFRRFARSGSEDRGGDAGLGLAICKGIVEAHGGRIRAESGGPGLGSRFTFTLPTAETAATERNSLPATGEPLSQEGGPPILAVDDGPQTLMHVRSALSQAGYQPIVAAEPEEAPA